MLEMRPNCEVCDCDLPADSERALICSFECTFCEACISGSCPNCGGDLQKRPKRVGKSLERFPASTKRIVKN